MVLQRSSTPTDDVIIEFEDLRKIIPKIVTVSQAAAIILRDRWGGYGNRKAMHAMWDHVHEQHGRHMLPSSHYDGVFQAGLRALVEDGDEIPLIEKPSVFDS